MLWKDDRFDLERAEFLMCFELRRKDEIKGCAFYETENIVLNNQNSYGRKKMETRPYMMQRARLWSRRPWLSITVNCCR